MSRYYIPSGEYFAGSILPNLRSTFRSALKRQDRDNSVLQLHENILVHWYQEKGYIVGLYDDDGDFIGICSYNLTHSYVKSNVETPPNQSVKVKMSKKEPYLRISYTDKYSNKRKSIQLLGSNIFNKPVSFDNPQELFLFTADVHLDRLSEQSSRQSIFELSQHLLKTKNDYQELKEKLCDAYDIKDKTLSALDLIEKIQEKQDANKQLCTNQIDVVSLDNITSIPYPNIFRWKQSGKTYCVNIQDFENHNFSINPWTREPFSDAILQDYMKKRKALHELLLQITPLLRRNSAA